MYSPAAKVVSPDQENPPDPSDLAAAVQLKDQASAKIRLIRWISSSKQVFIAELLVRSAGWDRREL
jgi:hypothetical protein